MFNKVKTKLTIIYTLSLLCLLIVFIGLLYFLISREINQKEFGEIQSYFQKEKMDFIEDIYDKKDRGLKYEPNQAIFYYIYNQKNDFVYGEETTKSLYQWIEKNSDPKVNSFSKRLEWEKEHFLLVKEPLRTNGVNHGFVILGINITGETHLVQNIMWTLFILTVLFSLFYAIMGYYFAGQAMKPIKIAFRKQEKFVSDASHELRTPLSIFYSSVDLLMREENLSAYGSEVLQDVKEEAELMNSLISSLLFLARSDKEQLPMTPKEVNLSELMTTICKRIKRTATNNIQFEQQIESDVYLTCDEIRIQQLLYILLDNAFRYTKEGKVTIALQSAAGKKIIKAQDTGCGISEVDLPYIFDRFYRADVSREKGGSGLGLSIAKAIVTAHCGKIVADSTIGKGSTLTVIFE